MFLIAYPFLWALNMLLAEQDKENCFFILLHWMKIFILFHIVLVPASFLFSSRIVLS